MVYQPWIQGFNPRNPKGLLIPFWISFLSLPLEYLKLAHTVASQVGKILATDINLDRVPPARFSVGVDISQGWVSTVVGHSAVGGSALIPVLYDGFELQCRICGHDGHQSAACPRLQSNHTSRPPAPPAPAKPPHNPAPHPSKDHPRRHAYPPRYPRSQDMERPGSRPGSPTGTHIAAEAHNTVTGVVADDLIRDLPVHPKLMRRALHWWQQSVEPPNGMCARFPSSRLVCPHSR